MNQLNEELVEIFSSDAIAFSDIEIMSIQFVVRTDEPVRLVQSIGSVLHGFIMECVESSYAGVLHSHEIRPYNQYVFFDKNTQQYIWRISGVTKDVVDNLIRVIYNIPDKVFLKQKNAYLYIEQREIIEATTYQALMDRFFTTDIEYKGATFNFMSPVSFKVDGQYAIYPEAFRLFRYWLKRWNAFSSFERMESEELLCSIEQSLQVRHYSLNLQRFNLEKIAINGFKGTFTVQYRANLVVRQILTLLSYYGQFTGVGIKTALGMGGVVSILEEKK